MSTRALVNMCILNNATWQDAFTFGTTGDTSWSFSNKTFSCLVKASVDDDDADALIELTSAAGEIVVDDVVTRTLHYNVTSTAIKAAMKPATYQYDLVMIDNSVPPVRTVLMGGEVTVEQGVSQS